MLVSSHMSDIEPREPGIDEVLGEIKCGEEEQERIHGIRESIKSKKWYPGDRLEAAFTRAQKLGYLDRTSVHKRSITNAVSPRSSSISHLSSRVESGNNAGLFNNALLMYGRAARLATV